MNLESKKIGKINSY